MKGKTSLRIGLASLPLNDYHLTICSIKTSRHHYVDFFPRNRSPKSTTTFPRSKSSGTLSDCFPIPGLKGFSMSTSSGRSGYCNNRSCRHPNNEHSIRRCRAHGCRVDWKRCQVAGKCNGVHYRVCKSCSDHPGASPF